jgi:uncharacterized RDD family membrane protein YckC
VTAHPAFAGSAAAVAPSRATAPRTFAGFATRFGSWVVDVIVADVAYAAMAAAARYLAVLLLDWDSPGRGSTLWRVGLGLWLLVYNWAAWATTGRTPGQALLGLRVVRGDGTELGTARALVRALVYPISFALAGLGFIGVFVGRRHRALHDVAADSVVIYDWDNATTTATFEPRAA